MLRKVLALCLFAWSSPSLALTLVGLDPHGTEQISNLPKHQFTKRLIPLMHDYSDRTIQTVELQQQRDPEWELYRFALGLEVRGRVGLGPVVNLNGNASIELIFTKVPVKTREAAR